MNSSNHRREAEAYKGHTKYHGMFRTSMIVRYILMFCVGCTGFVIYLGFMNPSTVGNGNTKLKDLQLKMETLKRHYNTTLQEKLMIQNAQMSIEKQLNKLKKSYKALEKKKLESDNTIMKFKSKLNTTATKDQKLENKKDKRIEHLLQFKLHMKQNIKDMSKRLIKEKFGTEPFYVEMNIAYDPKSNIYDYVDEKATKDDEEVAPSATHEDRIVIQMAPVNEMPHAVYTFLESVRLQLFDGTSFHRNANHIVQAGPGHNFLSTSDKNQTRIDQLHKFQTAGLKHMLFQEYSPEFPHVKYTLGYAGRPGGPDFYINLKDNTAVHGPGGQTSYEVENEADPCFAKVVEGMGVVDRMHQAKTDGSKFFIIDHPIAIKSMRIIKDLTDAS